MTGLFSTNEGDAIREINKINSKMQEIRVQLVTYGDCVNRNNAHKIAELLKSCADYYGKYERCKSKMNSFDLTMFYGAQVKCWNGETVGPLQWELYFQNIAMPLADEVGAILK